MRDEAQLARERIFADELARVKKRPTRGDLLIDGLSLCAAFAGVAFLVYSWVAR